MRKLEKGILSLLVLLVIVRGNILCPSGGVKNEKSITLSEYTKWSSMSKNSLFYYGYEVAKATPSLYRHEWEDKVNKLLDLKNISLEEPQSFFVPKIVAISQLGNCIAVDLNPYLTTYTSING